MLGHEDLFRDLDPWLGTLLSSSGQANCMSFEPLMALQYVLHLWNGVHDSKRGIRTLAVSLDLGYDSKSSESYSSLPHGTFSVFAFSFECLFLPGLCKIRLDLT